MTGKRAADKVRHKFQAAGALDGAANWIHAMEPDELIDLADRADRVAAGLVGAASRLRRIAKQKKKGGSTAAHHIKQ